MKLAQVFAGLGIALSLAMAIAVHGQASSADTEVVAEVNGARLTAADLDQKEGGKLLQARYQFYLSQRKALDELIDEELLQRQAQAKNLPLPELLEREVYKNVQDPSEEQLQVFYEGLDTQEPYASVRQSVLERIRELRRSKARAAYLQGLHQQAQVHILLESPAAEVDTQAGFVRGAKDAPVTLVEFADYECPYCGQVNPLLQQLEKEYGSQLSVIYKDFPLPMHHRAQKAAEAARCAGDQGKFWEMHDVLFSRRRFDIADLKSQARDLKLNGNHFDRCLDDGIQAAAVKQDLEQGKRLGLGGTPSFFVNGHFFSGAVDYKTLKEMVDQQLANARMAQQQLSRK